MEVVDGGSLPLFGLQSRRISDVAFLMGFSATHHLGHVKLEVSAPKLIVEVLNQWKKAKQEENYFLDVEQRLVH